MSFGDIVWFIFISFAFVAYLMVLFTILGDLFRDRGTSGWVKAVWIIALIVFPFLTGVHLHHRPRSRHGASGEPPRPRRCSQQTDAYIREVAAQRARHRRRRTRSRRRRRCSPRASSPSPSTTS